MRAVDVTRWHRHQEPDGTIVLTAPPVHPAFARERHAQLRVRRGLPLAHLGGTRLVTRTGEYGALRVDHVTLDDRPYVRALGSVMGDDLMTIEGLAASPNIIELVRDLTIECTWLGAPDRIRMVPYRPPAGWFGVRRDLATGWLAPQAPVVLLVGDAVPRGPAERTHALRWPWEPPADAALATLAGTALPGTVSTWTRADRLYATAVLGDDRWCIRLALQHGRDEDLVTLQGVARSIEIPPLATRSEVHRWM